MGTSYSNSFLKSLRSFSATQTLALIGLGLSSAFAVGYAYENPPQAAPAHATSNHFFSALDIELSLDSESSFEINAKPKTAAQTAHDPSAATTHSSSKTDVQVNGQSIAVPTNGQVHKVIKQEGGQTTVDISANSSNSSYSTNININSSSSSHGQ
jgi:hypothetical protein